MGRDREAVPRGHRECRLLAVSGWRAAPGAVCGTRKPCLGTVHGAPPLGSAAAEGGGGRALAGPEDGDGGATCSDGPGGGISSVSPLSGL